jgi:hypothetical protein
VNEKKMKELIIQVKYEDNGKLLASVIKKNGFDDSVSSTLQIMGALTNLMITEQEKLRTSVKITRDNNFIPEDL